MNKWFRAFEPAAVMLVPPSLDERLPQNHLSRFIAGIVETQLDLKKFYASYAKSKGQPPYDPWLMVRVLLYGYCVGVRSSRELERVCVDVVAFAGWPRSRHRIFVPLPGSPNATSPVWGTCSCRRWNCAALAEWCHWGRSRWTARRCARTRPGARP